jgi:outer membrane immunogenic protein
MGPRRIVELRKTMKKFALATLPALAGMAVIASPAQANEGRVEARGGIAWANGHEEAVAGVAGGYDFDLGETTFFGVEGSADKILADGADVVWGATARVGAKMGANGKLYAAGGYTFGEGEDTPHLGAGYQHRLGTNLYVKGEYRHFFSDFVDVNTAVVGVGFNF